MNVPISVILPQFGRSELTRAAVETLQLHHSHDVEILIVDDGSQQSERRGLQHCLRGNVTLLRNRSRRGVTAAWNQAAGVAQGEFLIFLNNDTLTSGAWMSQLIRPLQSGACLLTGPQWRRAPELADSPAHTARVLAGWCLAMRSDVFQNCGRFDEQFRLYFSDTDLQLRFWSQSRTALMAVSGLPVSHLGHRSTQQLVGRNREWRADQLRFQKKWCGRN